MQHGKELPVITHPRRRSPSLKPSNGSCLQYIFSTPPIPPHTVLLVSAKIERFEKHVASTFARSGVPKDATSLQKPWWNGLRHIRHLQVACETQQFNRTNQYFSKWRRFAIYCGIPQVGEVYIAFGYRMSRLSDSPTNRALSSDIRPLLGGKPNHVLVERSGESHCFPPNKIAHWTPRRPYSDSALDFGPRESFLKTALHLQWKAILGYSATVRVKDNFIQASEERRAPWRTKCGCFQSLRAGYWWKPWQLIPKKRTNRDRKAVIK